MCGLLAPDGEVGLRRRNLYCHNAGTCSKASYSAIKANRDRDPTPTRKARDVVPGKRTANRPSSAGELRRAISQFALADSWTPEQAEKWWKLHMPEKTVAGVEIDLKERGLQANVQQI